MRNIFTTTDADHQAGYPLAYFAIDDRINFWRDQAKEWVQRQECPAYRITWLQEDPETDEIESVGTAEDLWTPTN